jgi:hypothetical protein
MKKLALLLPFFALMACAPSITPGGDPKTVAGVYVKNSAWASVPASEIVKTVAKAAKDATVAVTIADVEAAADAHNAATPDDHWFVLTEDIPVDLAPDAPAWIVNSATLQVYWSDTVSRADLATRREAWRLSVEVMADPNTGNLVPCTLYVDQIPPEPPIIVVPGPKLDIALYNTRTMLYYWSEHYELVSSAQGRYTSMVYEAATANADPLYMGEGPWMAYWGDKPFPEAFPDYSPGTLP